MSQTIKFATGPVSWGVDFADTPTNPPWRRVLDEIAESGVGALELGPVGYLPEDPEALRAALDARGLVAVGSFVFDDFHDPDRAAHVVRVAERAARAIAAAGGTVLVIIDRPSGARVATAGRSEVATRLDERSWSAMLGVVTQVAESARRHGLRPAFHPHAASYVEFDDEIERLAGDTDLGLCLDTGHLAYAGSDVVGSLASYASRLTHVHLKDVSAPVLQRARTEGLDFWTAISEGIFCPLGDGVVDFPAVLGELVRQRYGAYATIEQDRVPGSGTPLEDVRASLEVVRRCLVPEVEESRP